MKKRESFWVVMSPHKWDSITISGVPLPTLPEGPHRFLPVFNTKREAVRWYGSSKNIKQLQATWPTHD